MARVAAMTHWAHPSPPLTPQQLRKIAQSCRDLADAMSPKFPEDAGYYRRSAAWFDDEASRLEQ